MLVGGATLCLKKFFKVQGVKGADVENKLSGNCFVDFEKKVFFVILRIHWRL
jgi:hypothetical protein